MAATFTLISSVTVGSGGAAYIEFTGIPATYTDLLLKYSLRTERTNDPGDEIFITFNNSGSSYSGRYLRGYGTGVDSFTLSSSYLNKNWASTNNATSSTFSNQELYIPNYAGSNNKSVSIDSVSENNGSAANAVLVAGLWSNSAAITSIKLVPEVGPNLVQYSTAYLYGISSS